MAELATPGNDSAVRLPLTCGELVQGTYRGRPALVSCPIDQYQTASVHLMPGKQDWLYPDQVPKTVQAFQHALPKLPASLPGGRLILAANPPRERGYGTSTADLGASLYALGAAAGSLFSPREVAELCLAVEPSDSTIYPGICLFDHRKGSQVEAWGQAPPLEVVVLDPGGGVDTLKYNQRNFQGKLQGLQSQHQEAFELLKIGLQQSDPQAIGRAATLSARAHQEILPNQLVDLMLKHLPELPALGICRAHSGTLVGVLIDPRQIPSVKVADIVHNALPGGVRCRVHRLANGGPQYVCPQPQSYRRIKHGNRSHPGHS